MKLHTIVECYTSPATWPMYSSTESIEFPERTAVGVSHLGASFPIGWKVSCVLQVFANMSPRCIEHLKHIKNLQFYASPSED